MDKKEILSAQNDNSGNRIGFNETVVQFDSVDAQPVSALKSITGITDWENAEQVQLDIILDRYRVIKQLGEGSFGRVFLARDEKLDRLVAIKVAKKAFKDTERLKSFFEEARILASLDHPHIVPVYDVGSSEVEGVFFISKFIDGVSLAQKIKQGDCSLEDAITRVLMVSEALGHAHEKGLVHRDVKPDNILLDKLGNAHVADFGLALKVDFSNKQTEFTGTPAYMSPEQAGGKGNLVDKRSDIFCLGVVFYELLCGERPFQGSNIAEIIDRVIKADFILPSKINPSIPKAVEQICLKALCKNKDARYASANEFSADLKSYLDSCNQSLNPKKINVNYKLVASLFCSCVIFLCFTAWLIHRGYEADLNAKAKTMVAGVFLAEGKSLELALEKSDEFISRTSLIYRNELAGMDKSDPRRMKALLGLGCGNPELDRELCDLMLKANVPDFLVVRKRLEPSKQMLIEGLVQKFKKADADELLRLGGAISSWAPDHPIIDSYLPQIADKLLVQNKLFLVEWAEVFLSVKDKLYPLLISRIKNFEIESFQRDFATGLCCELCRGDSAQLFDLMEVSDPRNARAILAKMIPLKGEVLQLTKNIRASKLEMAGFPQNLRFQDRRGIAAAIQISLGEEAGFSVFSFSPDPTAKSKCQLMLGQLSVSPAMFVEKINSTSDISAKSAIVVALGDLDLDSIDFETKSKWKSEFLALYKNSPDAGLHGALDWLLRKRWSMAKECDLVCDSLKSKKVPGNKWLVNSIGQTFVILEGPTKFQIGSPLDEPLRYEAERIHERAIARSIVVAQKEVTLNDFLTLMPQQRYIEKYSKTADSAMICISWYDSARFCNLLTEKEFGASECVYLPNDQGLYEEGMRIVDEPLKKKGYRMPTEAEFEFFYRAGSLAMFNHGSDIRLTDRYSVYFANSKDQVWPVGSLRPNEFGLFDTGGNVFEWCLESYDAYPDLNGADEDVFFRSQNKKIMTNISRVMRGGCFYNQIGSLRSADRNGAKPDDRSNSRGLRLVRSLP
ncbi:MAG: bifunctional serine/threonine-protein kinase/formylglycine-generating enzyme family protein [Planctomycetota bacterium]|nr:bifunctional serine/threonine-protein kinase/formylglycine-generating enzyme family protein [Planctomycetota bacterium]